ncbi:MAG: SUMF1/EgtB/PvdO family nonheme iron enzyme [Planctomycetota bacterium]
MRRVFISFAEEDCALAGDIAGQLRSRGHDVFVYDEQRAGSRFASVLETQIRDRCDVLVVVCTEDSRNSEWVECEILCALGERVPVFPLLAVSGMEPFFRLLNRDHILFHSEARVLGYQRLLRSVEETPARADRPKGSAREIEDAYLYGLLYEELRETQLYVPLEGARHRARRSLRLVQARPEFQLLPALLPLPGQASTEELARYDDVTCAVAENPRAVILGEPGAGKTTTLLRIARELTDERFVDPQAPLPLFARLGSWEGPEGLIDFLLGRVGEFAPRLTELALAGGVYYILDGLNELPVAERVGKARQVRALITDPRREWAQWKRSTGRSTPSVVLPGSIDLPPTLLSCREGDYGALDQGLDRIIIRPLDPPRILEFSRRTLAEVMVSEGELADDPGEVFFWKLSGGDPARSLWEDWERAGGDLSDFFASKAPPEGQAWTWRRKTEWEQTIRGRGRRSLMGLAENPYLLVMLLQVYASHGTLPPNRGQLMRSFVLILLAREQLADRSTGALTEEGQALFYAVLQTAQAFQDLREGASREAVTMLPLPRIPVALTAELRRRATSASLIQVDGAELRFRHQLLQEYFASEALLRSVAEGRQATDLWPVATWWERTNWEEVAPLAAGLADSVPAEQPVGTDPFLEWLASANPEVAAQSALASGVSTSDALLGSWGSRWATRLGDNVREPQPEARAAVGRAIGLLRTSDGTLLDDRPGVGTRRLSGDVCVPDIAWVQVAGARFRCQEKPDASPTFIPNFWLSRYPITNAQFQAFVEDDTGWTNPDWWEGLEHPAGPTQAMWTIPNHPRETVSWFEAVAFTRWLDRRLRVLGKLPAGSGFVVRLPTEEEWELAASGTEHREYPWGKVYQAGRANIDEVSRVLGDEYRVGIHALGRTSAVGCYPSGATPAGVQEMAGNVWEWTASPWEHGSVWRVVRGGSWSNPAFVARAAYRSFAHPESRSGDLGFRVCCGSPISQDP